MQRSFECSTTASSVVKKQSTGQTAAHGALVKCMHTIDTERSPGLPPFTVTTRRRLMPQGTSCSFLHAVTQALHSMPRPETPRNFIRPMPDPSCGSDLAERGLGRLHSGDWIEAIGRDGVGGCPEYDRVGAGRILVAHVAALIPA